jgi:hypothetical protein
MRWLRALIGVLVLAAVVAPAAGGAAPIVRFRLFARTGLRLTDIAWTGRQFLYVENTTNRVWAAGPAGRPIAPFATMPRQVEETRCRLSPGAHGFPAGDTFCHSPDNTIYRISPDGREVSVFATLPRSARSDGALAFDTVGAFAYALIAVTGRSGAPAPRGGSAFAIAPTGVVRRIGSYDTPGGADEATVAPPGFGTAAGQLLLAVDAGKGGSLVAMDPRGRTRTLVTLPDGPNPIAVLAPGQAGAAGAAQAGLYVTDTLSRAVFFAPAAALAPLAGNVVLGSELLGHFWTVRPRGAGFAAVAVPTNLTGTKYNLEGAVYIAP